MSFTSIVKVLPEALRHPAGLAMIGSFAFHGFLLAGGIPLIPGESDAINSQRLVSLIKLSPAEQSRLPQAASSQIAPLPQPPPDLSSFVLPPMAKLPDVGQQPELFDLPSPNLPTTPNLPPSSMGVPSIGTAPPIRIAPYRQLPVSPNQIPSQTTEDSSPFSPPNSDTQPLPNLPEPTLPDVAASPPSNFPENSPSPSDQQIDPSVKETFENQPLPDQPSPEAPGTSKDLDSMNQSLARAREISGDPGLAAQNINIPPVYPKAACQDRPEGSAIVWATVRPNGELAEAPTLQGTSGSKILDDAALEAVKRYQFPPSGKYQAFLPILWFEYSEEACADDVETPSPSPSGSPSTSNQSSSSDKGSTNLSQSLTDARQKYDSKLALRPVDVDYAYPEAACEGRLEGQPQVTATVKPNGELAEKPTITKSTGQVILNNAAVNAMAKHSFPATGKLEAYVFSPSFDYSEEQCSEAGVSQPSDEDSKKTTPKSSQENSGSSKSSTSSKDSDSPASSKKSNQPTLESPSENSEGAASQSEESAPQESSETTEEPTPQESPEGSEETTTP